MSDHQPTAPLPPPAPPLPPAPPAVPPPRRLSRRSANTLLANGLVALGSAAVLAAYTAGYVRTEAAAQAAGAGAETPPLAPVPAPIATTAPAGVDRRSASSDRRRGERRPPPAAQAAPTAVPPTVPATASAPTTPPTISAAPTARPAGSPAPVVSAGAALRDGAYGGSGTSRHGGIDVTVTVQGGKIAAVVISRCGTRYPCSRIEALPGQVLARQSPAVDLISRATDSSVAFRTAVSDALSKAR